MTYTSDRTGANIDKILDISDGYETTTGLIASSNTVVAGDIFKTLGYTSKGDGGCAQWKVTGATVTASQTPAQLGASKCSDADGNEFELVHVGVMPIESIGGLTSLNGVWEVAISSGKKWQLDNSYTLTAYSGATAANTLIRGDGDVSVNGITRFLTITTNKFKLLGVEFNSDGLGSSDNAIHVTSNKCRIECELNGFNSPNTGTVLLTNGAQKNRVKVDAENNTGSVVGISDPSALGTKYNYVTEGIWDNNSEFGVFIFSGATHNTVALNIGDNNSREVVGITQDCPHNVVIGNTCLNDGDNGISLSSDYNVCIGNQTGENQKAGIWSWGSYNAISGNVSFNNNKEDAGNNWAGIGWSANFGGAGQFNTVVGNSVNDYQSTQTQWNSVRNGGLGYSNWVTATSYTAGTDYVINGLNIYLATTTGTSGATAPTHTSGEVSDGGVTWRYIKSFRLTAATNGEVVVGNTTGTAQSDDYSFGANNADGLYVMMRVATDYEPETRFIAPPSEASNPGFGRRGMMYNNTTTNVQRYFNGTSWVDV